VAIAFPFLLAPRPSAASERSLPRPDLSHLEPVVREQLQAVLTELTELEGAEAPPADDLAAAYGRAGELFYVYDLAAAAAAAFAHAHDLQPESFRWVYLLAIVQRLEGDHPSARESLEHALDLQPDSAPAWTRLGEVLLELGNEEDSEASYRRALDLDPDLAAAHEGLGRLAYDRGEPAAALASWQRALELQPRATSLHHRLGLAYRALGDREAARRHFEANRGDRVRLPDPILRELSELVTSTQVDFKAGVQAMRHGNAELALERFERALEAVPDDPLVPYNLALAHLRLGDETEAERWLRRSLELDAGFRNGHYNLASLLAASGRLAEAEEHFRRAHEIDPADSASHVGWAKALAGLGDKERALAELEGALQRAPGAAEALVVRGIVQAQLGRDEAAEESFRAAAANGSAEAWLELGLLLERLGRREEAETSYRRATGAAADRPEPWEQLASALGRWGRYDEAAEAFAGALAVEPGRVEARVGGALSLLLAGEEAAARASLEEGIARRPDSVALRHLLARVLATSSDTATRDGARALELARWVLERSRTLDHAETLAMALAEVGRFEEAVALQEEVVRQIDERDPPEGLVLAREALAAYRRGEPLREPWRRAG
jgi:tetratricopeptide (TPR) repeat protein